MLNQLSTMIRDSNNDVANDIFFGLAAATRRRRDGDGVRG
jgi:hypothetical protein